MNVAVLVAGLFLGTAFCRDQFVTIDSSSCGQEFTLDGADELRVYYNGASLRYTCKITINSGDYSKHICTYPDKFDLNSCAATIQYHEYSYSSTYSYDEQYTCSSKQYGQYCTSASALVIAVDKNGAGSFGNGDSVDLKVTLTIVDEFLIDSAKTAVSVIIGIIVGVVVLLIILSIVVVICCCRRQQNQAGTVYRAPGQGTAVTTSVGYPMTNQQQAGYQQPGFQQQPPPAGYQQPPPAGFQQPPPAGYQQPPPAGFQQPPPAGYQQTPPAGFQQPPGYQQQGAGYPPAAQQGHAGFQTGPNAPITDKASAPPMEYPPPYS